MLYHVRANKEINLAVSICTFRPLRESDVTQMKYVKTVLGG